LGQLIQTTVMNATDDQAARYTAVLHQIEKLKQQRAAHLARSVTLMAEAQRIMSDLQEGQRARCLTSRSLAALVEARVLAERANSVRTQVLAAVAHDMKQPVQVIAAASEMLRTRILPSGEKLLLNIDTALDRLARAIEMLLEAARLASDGVQAATVRSFAIGPLLREVSDQHRAQAETKGLMLRVVDCAATVSSNERRLGSILHNLVQNAIKYTERGKILVGCRHRGDLLEIQIHDTGRGIAPDQLDLIFQQFTQVDSSSGSGFGLGLFIVRQQAAALNHRLVVRSTLGRGSCFGVDVPLARTAS
jgi:signal transduction histidine kinase